LLALELPIAVTDQLDRDAVDAGASAMLRRGERRQFPVIVLRQVAMCVRDLRRDEVEVVEQPLRCGGEKPSLLNVADQQPVRMSQHSRVLLEARERISGAGARIDREASRNR
jgi:hypothetical protein